MECERSLCTSQDKSRCGAQGLSLIKISVSKLLTTVKDIAHKNKVTTVIVLQVPDRSSSLLPQCASTADHTYDVTDTLMRSCCASECISLQHRRDLICSWKPLNCAIESKGTKTHRTDARMYLSAMISTLGPHPTTPTHFSLTTALVSEHIHCPSTSAHVFAA
jgi:hypothetical protein